MRVLTRALAATTLVAAAGLVGAPGAGAAACSAESGVTVVVDYQQLGGGIVQSCVADQGDAADLFLAAGHSLENVQNQAFVCRVDSKPSPEQQSCARTPPANAYWGLWWSDGSNGTWTYASQGAYQLDVPDGGAVAFSWNGSSSTTKPGVAPPDHSEEPAEQPAQPPAGGGGGSTGGAGAGAGGGSTPSGSGTPDAPATPSPTESPSAPADADRGDRQREARDGDRPASGSEREDRGTKQDAGRDRQRDGRDESAPDDEATPTPGAEAPATAAEPPSSAPEDGLPVWVGPTAVGVLLPMAGLAAYLRRRNA